MEQKESNIVAKNNNNAIVANDGDKKKMMIKDHQGTPKPMKKRGAMHFIRVALYMLRRKSKKSMHVDLAAKVLGSIRPLNLHTSDSNNNNQRRSLPASKDIEAPPAPQLIEQTMITEEVFTPPASPTASKSIVSSSSTDSLSQYASALNLRDLDTCGEGEEEYDDNGGDEMIDAKAEEFINQFYQQMRIQNFEYMNSHNERKMKRAVI